MSSGISLTLECCIVRIQSAIHCLEAVIWVDPDALEIAKQLDRVRQSWRCSAASPPKDGFSVSRLCDAGVMVPGHVLVSNWASLRSDKYFTGCSPHRGADEKPV